MVSLNGQYQADPNASNSYDPVPPGEYQVMMVNSQMNSQNTGISCEFDVVSGQFQGRKLWINLALFHDNPKAQEVGQRFLNDMCLASGKMSVGDTSELHGITMVAKVKLRKDDASQNDISGFKPVSSATVQSHQAQPVQSTPAQAPASIEPPPPWRK